MPLWKRIFGGSKRDSRSRGLSLPQAPTIQALRRYRIGAVGESNYQPALWRAIGQAAASERGYRVDALATLIPEPTNLYDENAIQVIVNGDLVAYLSRDDADDYGDFIGAVIDQQQAAVCHARIMGGFRQNNGQLESLGIWLDLPSLDASELATEARVTGSRSTRSAVESSTHGLVRGKHYTDYVEDVKTL